MTSERVLLIEDDHELGTQIAEQLGRAGFVVTWWKEGRTIEAGDVPELALVILDLMLPGTYGMDILKDLRARSEVPVLVLSARSDTADKVRALKLGADDYMTKPFWPEELLERVKARLRRPILQRVEVVEVGALRIDLAAHEVHREAAAAGVMMLPIPQAGVLRETHGLLQAQAVPGVVEVAITARPGEELVPLPEGAAYLGFLFARGATPAAVDAALRAAHRELRFVIQRTLKTAAPTE